MRGLIKASVVYKKIRGNHFSLQWEVEIGAELGSRMMWKISIMSQTLGLFESSLMRKHHVLESDTPQSKIFFSHCMKLNFSHLPFPSLLSGNNKKLCCRIILKFMDIWHLGPNCIPGSRCYSHTCPLFVPPTGLAYLCLSAWAQMALLVWKPLSPNPPGTASFLSLGAQFPWHPLERPCLTTQPKVASTSLSVILCMALTTILMFSHLLHSLSPVTPTQLGQLALRTRSQNKESMKIHEQKEWVMFVCFLLLVSF